MYDYVIVGSGIAGLYTALLAGQHGRVLVLTKAGLNDSNTNHAQGGIAAAVGGDDAPALHWQDTLVAGAGLSDPAAAWVLTREAPERIGDLIHFGVPFDRNRAALALAREGAHSRPRVLHAGGDGTGAAIQATLAALARGARNVTIREHHRATELIVAGGRARGVMALDGQSGALTCFEGRAVVLASGGAGQLYQHTTNPAVATGAGVALAYRAGASVADLEFCQFHPTALALPGAPRFLISEAARGEGAVLRDARGRRFMPDYDPRAELAPRHVVAGAIMAEMAREGAPCVFLDLTHLPREQVRQRFPGIAAFCAQHGLDITRQSIAVAPAAHYMMGGVRTNLWGETNLPGLFACGEVACTGVHGANRLASNSLLEGLVFGARIVRRTALDADDEEVWRCWSDEACVHGNGGGEPAPVLEDYRFGPPADSGLPAGTWWSQRHLAGAVAPVELAQVQEMMWTCAGMARSRESLGRARRQLSDWSASLPAPSSIAEHERRDLLLVGQLVVAAALLREETRGAHHRVDFPAADPAWRRRLVLRALVAPAGRLEVARVRS